MMVYLQIELLEGLKQIRPAPGLDLDGTEVHILQMLVRKTKTQSNFLKKVNLNKYKIHMNWIQ